MRSIYLVLAFAIGCSNAPTGQSDDLGADAGAKSLDASREVGSAGDTAIEDAPADDDARPVDVGADLAESLDLTDLPDLTDASEPDLAASLPTCVVGLADAFSRDRIAPPAEDSDGYMAPDGASLGAMGSAIAAVLDGDAVSATQRATAAGYVVCRLPAESIVLFEPVVRGAGHAALAMRDSGTSQADLFVQAPHIVHDTNTLPQALAVFEATAARALLVSGTHRCASSLAGCSGTSTVCNRLDDGYAASDMAHAVDSFYQAAHVTVSERFSGDIVISLHGMTRAGASISDGTDDAVAADSVVAKIAAALVGAGASGVTSCNSGTSVPTEQHLCGTTNTQGRHLNGSLDACFQSAAAASGRFVHLEQDRSLRDDPTMVVTALETVFRP